MARAIIVSTPAGLVVALDGRAHALLGRAGCLGPRRRATIDLP
jgi:hypothetical protein